VCMTCSSNVPGASSGKLTNELDWRTKTLKPSLAGLWFVAVIDRLRNPPVSSPC
jgi:hypothetical protein